jgi:rifampicin phosphotransferase
MSCCGLCRSDDKFFNLQVITRLARGVEEFYNAPQDLEFAVDSTGHLYLLQARPITTLDDHGSLSFLPPGDGFWTFDPVHFPRPISRWMGDNYSLDYGSHHSRRTGCLVKSIALRMVHSFVYNQPVFLPPSEELERAAQAYWSKRLYEDDYREFVDFYRPDCEALQEELRSVNPSSLGHTSLVAYVARCFDLAVEFWKRHHTYSFPTMIIVGDYANRMGALVGKDPMDTLALLENASPESRGLLNREDPLLAEMYSLLQKSDKAMALLKCDESSASWALDCLMHMPDRLGEVMRDARLQYGWRLAGGYDLVVPTLCESPNFFLKTLLQGVEEGEYVAAEANARVQKLAEEWKSALPIEKHDEFEEILQVGRRFFRIRDERGLCTDLSGVGLCRRGILEGGRRLAEQGIIYKAEHLCVATKNEAIALLRGDLSLLSGGAGVPRSTLEIPTPRELERRFKYVKTADPGLIPRALGTPPPPPDFSQLPPGIGRTMAAFATGCLRGIFYERDDSEDEEVGPDTVKGCSASTGIVEGPVRLVLQDDDLAKVKKGDIVVTYSCSASFNIVLALCAGICTDYGM